MIDTIMMGDCLTELKKICSNSIDLLVTDPPYGLKFMGKDWDKAVPSVDVWRECLRVLKAGSFGFIMCTPRQDCLSRMVVNLEDAGFNTGFTSIYWTYASGFPKAMNIGKTVDKRNDRHPDNREFRQYLRNIINESGITQKQIQEHLGNYMLGHYVGDSQPTLPTLEHWKKLKEILPIDDCFDELIERVEAEREIIGKKQAGLGSGKTYAFTNNNITDGIVDVTIPETVEAKRLDGSYGGFQPKPAVEIILVVMKPLSEKTFTDQALKNGKGVTWLDDCRIPINSHDKTQSKHNWKPDSNYRADESVYELGIKNLSTHQGNGRFPANLLVSDNMLDDGRISKSGKGPRRNKRDFEKQNTYGKYDAYTDVNEWNDSGGFSRYFNLDKWASKTFPFLIVPKASKSERNKGLEQCETQKVNDGRQTPIDNAFQRGETLRQNIHPTVKPLKLISYLITLGSRPKDIILDPYLGSGTTALAAKSLTRHYIGIEINKEYCEIAEKRIDKNE